MGDMNYEGEIDKFMFAVVTTARVFTLALAGGVFLNWATGVSFRQNWPFPLFVVIALVLISEYIFHDLRGQYEHGVGFKDQGPNQD